MDRTGKSLQVIKKGRDLHLPELLGDRLAPGAGDNLAWWQGEVVRCKGDRERMASSTGGTVILCVTFAHLYDKQQGSRERAGSENRV